MNPSTSSRPAVVVGVDGTPGALRAAQWGAVEAAGRDLPLRLVFAIDPACSTGIDDMDARGAVTALAEAAHRVRLADGSVEVVESVVHGSPVAALVQGTERPAMICLGSSGPRPAHPGHHGSTATEVLLSADCPVAIVRGQASRHGGVVAPVDAEPAAFDVLALAVAEAVLRRLPLRALTGWTLRSVASSDPVGELDRRLRLDLDRWRRQHPHLDAVVVAAPDLGVFLSRNTGRVALFVGPERMTHDVGTVVHASVETAIASLDCPVIVGAGRGNATVPSARYDPPSGATHRM